MIGTKHKAKNVEWKSMQRGYMMEHQNIGNNNEMSSRYHLLSYRHKKIACLLMTIIAWIIGQLLMTLVELDTTSNLVTKGYLSLSLYHGQQNKCYPPKVCLTISKLHSILDVANLLAHNNISQICYWCQISLQSAAVFLTPLGVTFIMLVMVPCIQMRDYHQSKFY